MIEDLTYSGNKDEKDESPGMMKMMLKARSILCSEVVTDKLARKVQSGGIGVKASRLQRASSASGWAPGNARESPQLQSETLYSGLSRGYPAVPVPVKNEPETAGEGLQRRFSEAGVATRMSVGRFDFSYGI